MKYYVPVGPGGVFFRVGMTLTGMMGSLVYWRASRRRGAALAMHPFSPVGHPEPVIQRAGTDDASLRDRAPGYRRAAAGP
jgi:hypothetical protein